MHTVRDRIDTDSTRRIRAGAVAIHRTFAPIHHLLAEVDRLALNASVASGRLGVAGRTFATVSRDLHATSAELGARIAKVEAIFEGLARDVAAWSETERRLLLLRSAGQQAEAQLGGRRPDALRDAERRAMDALQRHMTALNTRLQSLDGHVDRIRWTAVRQTRYLCILASIEKAHLGDRGAAVESVVHAMTVLADQLSEVEEEARNRVLELHIKVDRLRRGGRHPAVGAECAA